MMGMYGNLVGAPINDVLVSHYSGTLPDGTESTGDVDSDFAASSRDAGVRETMFDRLMNSRVATLCRRLRSASRVA
jgi:hypothetical protein